MGLSVTSVGDEVGRFVCVSLRIGVSVVPSNSCPAAVGVGAPSDTEEDIVLGWYVGVSVSKSCILGGQDIFTGPCG